MGGDKAAEAALGVTARQAQLLSPMFDADLYAAGQRLQYRDGSGALDDFLGQGLRVGARFSSFYDHAHAAAALRGAGVEASGDPRRVLKAFLSRGEELRLSPTPLFDEAWYLEQHPDVRSAGGWGYRHFMLHGEAEGRAPSAALGAWPSLAKFTGEAHGGRSLRRYLAATPTDVVESVWRDAGLVKRLAAMVWPAFYRPLAHLPAEASEEQARTHFIAHGLLDGLRPNPLFDPAYYLAQLPQAARAAVAASPAGPLLHWLGRGVEARITPTPLFNARVYERRYPALESAWGGWAFEHYMLRGAAENLTASALFDPAFYAYANALPEGSNALLHYLQEGEAKGLRPHEHVSLHALDRLERAPGQSRLEAFAARFEAAAARLERSAIQEMLARAAAAEPQLMHGLDPEAMYWPPVRHHAASAARNGTLLKARVGAVRCDTLVFLPDPAQGQSAAPVTASLVETIGSRDVLALDLSAGQGSEAPPPLGWRVVAIGDLVSGQGAAPEVILLNLVRGARPRRIVNLGAAAAWLLYERYGAQLAADAVLWAYLPTGAAGAAQGAMLAALPHLDRLWLDSAAEAEALAARLFIPDPLAAKLRAIGSTAEVGRAVG